MLFQRTAHHHPFFVSSSSLYRSMNAANPLMIPAAHHSSYALSSSRRKDGKFDAIKYIKRRREAARRRRRKRRHAVSLVNLVGCGTSDSLAGSDDDDSAASPEPKLRCATNKHSRLDSSGVFQRIYPHTSTWYFLSRKNNKKWGWASDLVKDRETKSEAQRRKIKKIKKKGRKGFGLWVWLRIGLRE